MPYTAAYLLNQFRREADDLEQPYLWSDDDVNDYMDQAQEEFCRKIDCIPDTESFILRVKAGQVYADLEPVITQIRGGYSTTTKRLISPRTMRDMQRGYMTDDYGNIFVGDWRKQTGPVQFLITDDTIEKVRLTPIPDADDTITLSVYRLPVTRIVDAGELEIPDMFRRRLLLKMRSLAYLKNDSETFNKRQSDAFEGMWIDYLDQASLDLKRFKGGSRTTTYGGV